MRHQRVNREVLIPIAGLLAGALSSAAPAKAAGEAPTAEKPTEIVAAAVRQHGFTCDDPQAAERDEAASVPDEPVWVIACGNGRYRVQFMGGAGAKVEPLGE